MRKAFVIIGTFVLLSGHWLAAPSTASAGPEWRPYAGNGFAGAQEFSSATKSKKARKKATGGQGTKSTTPPQSPPTSTYY
jgi:hypothetical protein